MKKFGPFTPDAVDHNAEICLEADNVVRTFGGYASIPASVQKFSASTPSGNFTTVQNLSVWIPSEETYYTIMAAIDSGNAPEFYVAGNNAFHKTSTITYLSRWRWLVPVAMGDYLLMFGSLNTPQKILLSDLADLGVTKTTDIGGTPPAAKFAAVVRSQLLLGYTYESSTYYPNRVWWSAFDDFEGWTSGTNQAGSSDLQQGGEVTGIVGGEYGLIFQAKAVTRVNYIGSPSVWEFDPIDTRRGAIAPGSIVKAGRDVYFYSDQGFMAVRDGSVVEPVGRVIERWFKQESELEGSGTTTAEWTDRVRGVYDEVSGYIVWAWNDGGNSDDSNSRLLFFNTNLPPDEAWSTSTIAAHSLYAEPAQLASDTLMVFGIGMITGADGGTFTIDTITDTKDQFALDGKLVTGTIFNESRLTYLSEARAYITSAPGTGLGGEYDVTPLYLTQLMGDENFTTGTTVSSDEYGKTDHNLEARYIRLQFDITGNRWAKASGWTAKADPAGEF